MEDSGNTLTMAGDALLNRNRSITWARYILDSSDWVILAARATTVNTGDEAEGITLMSAAIVQEGGKLILERLVRANEFSARDAIEGHGLDYQVLLHAVSYQEVLEEIETIIRNRHVLVWDEKELCRVFNIAAASYGAAPPAFKASDVRSRYDRFNGVADGQSALASRGVSAVSECQAVLTVIQEMARSNQRLDAAASPLGWTAEFYKPKLTPAEKLKGFLGIE